MKLQVLAAAVAASLAFPMAAQAEIGISGDIGVFYDDAAENINEIGSEINFDGSTEQDGITYMGHMELDVGGTNNSTHDLRMDEVRVGAKGGFGEIWLGEVDNACDQFDPGANDIWLGLASQSCGGADSSSILYKNKMGAAEFAVSHNPGADESAVGARFELMEGVKANLGYEDGVGSDDDRVSVGIAGSFNGVDISVEANDDDMMGLHASYSANGSTFWGSYGDYDGTDNFAVGYRKAHGAMDYIIEYQDTDTADRTIAGMRYRF